MSRGGASEVIESAVGEGDEWVLGGRGEGRLCVVLHHIVVS